MIFSKFSTIILAYFHSNNAFKLNRNFSQNIVYFDERIFRPRKQIEYLRTISATTTTTTITTRSQEKTRNYDEIINIEFKREKILEYFTNYDAYIQEIGFLSLFLIILLLISITSLVIYYKTWSSVNKSVQIFIALTKYKLHYFRKSLDSKSNIEKNNKFMRIKFSDFYE